MARFWDWFAGGSTPYMRLDHCMNYDWPWIGLTVTLDVTVACGYLLIALHWWRNQRGLADSPAKTALGNMKNIFLFCGLCGYVFIPIKMVWPAWRLYDFFLMILAYFTWRYAWNAKNLRVIYDELVDAGALRVELAESRAESKRKTVFLNAISHDLRTPLNGLMLQTELAQLSLETRDHEALAQSLEEIKASARVAARLLDSFLELGRAEWSSVGDAVEFEVGAVWDELAASFRAQAMRQGLDLQFHAPRGLRATLDRTRLERIVQNLVENALKFTPRGGVRVEASASGNQLIVEVADTGIGIAEEHLGRIFEDFFQVENRGRDRTQGFGLGLAITRRLVEQLRGEFHVDSALGRGTRFLVTFPAAVPKANARDPDRTASARPEAGVGGRG